MLEIKIEKGVEAPPRRCLRQELFAELKRIPFEIGDSFTLPSHYLTAEAHSHAKQLGLRFTSRAQPDGKSYRVWVIEIPNPLNDDLKGLSNGSAQCDQGSDLAVTVTNSHDSKRIRPSRLPNEKPAPTEKEIEKHPWLKDTLEDLRAKWDAGLFPESQDINYSLRIQRVKLLQSGNRAARVAEIESQLIALGL